MKRLAIFVILVLSLALTAGAGNVQYLQETFASGATFNGLVTFSTDYSKVTAVDGYLTGGPYGNDHFTWIWDPYHWGAYDPQYGNNLLMDGTTCGDECGTYSYWIAFTWDFSGAPNLVIASPGGLLSDHGGNHVTEYLSEVGGNNVVDPLVSGSISAVPEPATLGLIGLGLGCLGLVRRRTGA